MRPQHPLRLLKKTTEWSHVFTEKQFDQVKNAQTIILDEGLSNGNPAIKIKKIAIGSLNGECNRIKSDRNAFLVKRLSEIESNVPETTLRVVLLGTGHLFEHYVRSLKSKEFPKSYSIYSSPKVNKNTTQNNLAVQELMKVAGNYIGGNPAYNTQLRVFDDAIGSMLTEVSSIYCLRAELSPRVNYSALYTSKARTNPRMLFLSDTHGLNSVGHIQDLPSASDLQGLGIKKVEFYMEGYLNKKPVSADDLRYAYDMDYWMSKSDLYAKFKQAFPVQMQGIENGKGLLFPSLKALSQKAASYKKEGLSVSLEGMDQSMQYPSKK